MNIKQLLTKKNAQYATAALLVLATVCLLPHVRSLAISLTEHLMHRSLDHAYWERFLFLQTLKACSVIGAVLVLLSAWKTDDTRNNNILVFTVTILTMFFISNINIILADTVFTGYWTNWSFGDMIPRLPYGEVNRNFIGYARMPNMYTSNYPPVAVMIYKIMYAFFPEDSYLTVFTSNYLLTLILLAAACSLALFISKWMKQYDTLTMCLSFGLIFSSPSLFIFQSLNTALFAVVFTFIYLLCYKSENKAKKEIALIALALAANIKLYPAIFGLLLVKDKDWKTALRCAAYGILIFILPALIQNTSSAHIATAVSSTTTTTVTSTVATNTSTGIVGAIDNFAKGLSRFDTAYKGTTVSISSQVYNLLDKCGLLHLQGVLLPAATILTLIICLFFFAFAKTRHQELLFLGALCVLIPGVSHYHSMTFLVFALCEFLHTENKKSVWNKIQLALYLAMFVYVWGFLYQFFFPNHTFHLFALLILNAVLICKETDFKAIFTQLKTPKKR